MADYSVTARFDADASSYLQAVQQAQSATQQLGDTADRAGKQTAGAFSGADASVKKAGDAATSARGPVQQFGTTAQTSGKHAASAFDGMGDGIQAAGIQLDGASGKFTDLGNRASVVTQKIAQGVRNNAADLQTTGAAVATVGGAWTAANAVLAKTGIEYNTLQQTTGRALSTMMGSTEAAQRQMENLNAFVSESPFGRDTFLEAQQQLIAFGVEASDVVPILSGVEDAVAAIGGSDQEIQQVVDVLGAIQGQGKITGRELQRLGAMGIDAASLIGESMGKSGEAIRTEITNGTMDADTAIKALTDGMTTRFEGAAAGLKDTFTGAMQRVSAAVRDISGDMFSWAVGPEGGGLFVDLANGVADVIREVEKLPGPVKNAIGIFSTLGGATTLAAGGMIMLAPRALETWDAINRIGQATGAASVLEKLRDVAPGLGGALKNVGKFAGIAAVSLAAMKIVGSVLTEDQIYDVEQFDQAVQNLANTGTSSGIDRMFSDWATMKLPGVSNSTDDLSDMEDAMARLAEPRDTGDKINQWADKMFAWTGAAQSDLTQIEEKVTTFSDSLAGMVNEGEIESASEAFGVLADSFTANGGEVEDLIDLMPSYIDSLMSTAEAAGVTITESEALEWALSGVAPAAVEAAGGLDAIEESDALSKLGEEADSAAASVEGVTGKIQALGAEFRGAFLAEGDMYAAIDALTDSLAENGATLDATTEAGQKNRAALVGMFEASEVYATSIMEAGGSTDEAAGAMRTAYNTMIDNAAAMGLSKTEAEALARELLDIPDDVSVDTFFDNAAKEMAMALANEIEAIPEHKVIGIAAQEDGSFVSVQQSIDELGNTKTVVIDAEGNATEVTEEIRNIDGHDVKVYVDDDGTVYQLEGDLEEISQSRHSTTVEVDADTDGAQSDIDGIEGGEATVTTKAEVAEARGRLESITSHSWNTSITGVPYMSNAESAANTTARPRPSAILGVPHMSNAEGAANTTARPRFPLFSGIPQMGAAEGAANTTARTRFPLFSGIPQMGAAESSANTTARPRTTPITGIPYTGNAEGNLNNTARNRNSTISASKGSDGVSGWLRGLTAPRTVRVTAIAGGAAAGLLSTGGIAGGGVGHVRDALPRKATGGRLPYTGLGQDMILGHNRHGVPTAWVDDGEWVVRERMSRKYHQALGLINADHPAIHHLAGLADGGTVGRTRLVTTTNGASTSIDYTRLAQAVGQRGDDTAAIGAAVAHALPAALADVQIVTNIAGRPFYGAIQEATNRFGGR